MYLVLCSVFLLFCFLRRAPSVLQELTRATTIRPRGRGGRHGPSTGTRWSTGSSRNSGSSTDQSGFSRESVLLMLITLVSVSPSVCACVCFGGWWVGACVIRVVDADKGFLFAKHEKVSHPLWVLSL